MFSTVENNNKTILSRYLILLVILTSAAYFLNALLIHPLLSQWLGKGFWFRLSGHALYLMLIVFVWFFGRISLKKISLQWPLVLWDWSYVFVAVYAVISEILGFVIPSIGFYFLSAMAHTAFIFCTPIPYFALMMIVFWSDSRSVK